MRAADFHPDAGVVTGAIVLGEVEQRPISQARRPTHRYLRIVPHRRPAGRARTRLSDRPALWSKHTGLWARGYGIDAVPFQHSQINEWRQNFKGVQFNHASTNLIVTGAVDDLWINPAGEIIVVDYKATAKNGEVNIDADWQMAYKRQMEV